ncbi:unnamed protein product [[Candida] boidinii]|nr:unnamed protein product [[Candida] boidinii]
MTTAHRPTFDHAKGKANGKQSSIVHKKFLPAYTTLKYRKNTKKINKDFEDEHDPDNNNDEDGEDDNELEREIKLKKRKLEISQNDVKELKDELNSDVAGEDDEEQVIDEEDDEEEDDEGRS